MMPPSDQNSISLLRLIGSIYCPSSIAAIGYEIGRTGIAKNAQRIKQRLCGAKPGGILKLLITGSNAL